MNTFWVHGDNAGHRKEFQQTDFARLFHVHKPNTYIVINGDSSLPGQVLSHSFRQFGGKLKVLSESFRP